MLTEGITLDLGRGAMGITYKALDVNLRCPVISQAGKVLGGKKAV
ncbi:MAG TPA: hypothetical protein VGF37_07280 [Chthoniobacterales bacterium]|jgi:hypothetical protein